MAMVIGALLLNTERNSAVSIMPKAIKSADADIAITSGGYFSHTKAANTSTTSTYIKPISMVTVYSSILTKHRVKENNIKRQNRHSKNKHHTAIILINW